MYAYVWLVSFNTSKTKNLFISKALNVKTYLVSTFKEVAIKRLNTMSVFNKYMYSPPPTRGAIEIRFGKIIAPYGN